MHTSVLKLASLPHAIFNFMYFFLILEEEVGGLVVARNLGSEQQVVEKLNCGFESVKVVSAIFEMPKVILGVPWVLSLIVIRDCCAGSKVHA